MAHVLREPGADEGSDDTTGCQTKSKAFRLNKFTRRRLRDDGIAKSTAQPDCIPHPHGRADHVLMPIVED